MGLLLWLIRTVEVAFRNSRHSHSKYGKRLVLTLDNFGWFGWNINYHSLICYIDWNWPFKGNSDQGKKWEIVHDFIYDHHCIFNIIYSLYVIYLTYPIIPGDQPSTTEGSQETDELREKKSNFAFKVNMRKSHEYSLNQSCFDSD